MQKETTQKAHGLPRFFGGVQKVCGAWMLLIFALCAWQTCSAPSNAVNDARVVCFWLALVLALVLCVLVGVIRRSQPACLAKLASVLEAPRTFLLVTCVVVVAAFIWDVCFINNGSFVSGWDPGWISGDALFHYDSLSAYLSTFPNNLFLASFNFLVYKLGYACSIANPYVVLLYINAGMFELASALSAYIVKKLAGGPAGLCALGLAIFFVGINPLILVPYTDSFSVLPLIFFVWSMLYFPKQKWMWVLQGACASIAFAIKPTTIFLYASAVLIWFMYACVKKIVVTKAFWLTLGTGIVGVVLGLGAVTLAEQPLAKHLVLDPSKNMDMTYYLVMGANQETFGRASDDDLAFANAIADPHERAQANVARYVERVQTEGLPATLALYFNKMCTSFNDATFFWGKYETGYFQQIKGFWGPFATFYYVPTGIDAEGVPTFEAKDSIFSPYGAISYVLWYVVLLGMGATLFIKRTKTVTPATCSVLAMSASVVMLSVFLMVFEAWPRNIYLYLPVMLALSCVGWKALFCGFGAFRNNRATPQREASHQ